MKKLTWVLLFSLVSSVGYTQTLPGQNTSADVQEEAAKYERYYEVVLDNALSDYYRNGTFIVDVKATVEKVLVPRGYEVVEGEEAVRIENLPGLPFVPPNLRAETEGTQDTLKASSFDTSFRLTQLNVTVLVDTSYSDEDVEFVEEAAKLIANADAFRGDIVNVEKKVFPRSTRAIEQDADRRSNRAETANEDQDTENPLQTEVLGSTNAAPTEPEPNMFLGINWNDPQQLLYVIMFLGGLFLITLLYLLFRPKQKEGAQSGIGQTIDPQLLANIQNQSKIKEPTGPDAKTLALHEEDKTYLTNTFISTPKVVAEMINQWIASDEEQGVVRAVRGFKSIDEKLLNVLEPHMKVDTFETIRFAMNNADDIPIEEKIEEAQSFRRSIQQIKSTNGSTDSGSNLFDFVYQLTDQQMLHLMKEESDEMVSILLAQVAGERAGGILQKMDDNKRISILLKMGKINNIPISVYKKVAAHFSNKALSVSDMKYVAADGIDSILTTIETLPLTEQDDYVRSIAEQDLELAKRIRKFFIGFDDLPKVKDEFVQAALEEVQTETIILALRTAPAAVREKVLKVRPKREQQLILSEIDNQSEVAKSVIEDAQKQVLYAVRRKMKAEG